MPSRRDFLGAAAWMGLAAATSAAPAVSPATSSEDPPGPASSVRARILGIVQDGGLPHLGCLKSCCVAARRDPSRARRVASLGLFGSSGGSVILVDATPDIRSQVAELRGASGLDAAPGLPVDAILLTHAHVGHYAGLIYLGRESMAARGVPVVATPRMAGFLKSNKPWSRLVEWGHVRIDSIEPGDRRSLAAGIEVEVIPVPHRDEDSDTVGFLFTGPSKRLLYVPDTDAWANWSRPIASLVAGVDIALLDGTFFDAGEIPGRDLSEIPHPLVRSTMALLEKEAAGGRCRILFTHLNHSNPSLDPLSEEAAVVRRAGFAVAEEGMELAL